MLIAEDLLLLLTDDESGKLMASEPQVDLSLGGADLVELALAGKVEVTGGDHSDGQRAGRLAVRDAAPSGDTILDAALRVIEDHEGDKPAAVIRPLSRHLRVALYERLADAGMVRAEHGRVLGIIPRHRWPAQDAHHETEIRAAIVRALVTGGSVEPRTAALAALLHVLGCEHKIVDPDEHGITKRDLRARAEELARGDWASHAVRQTIQQLLAAVVAATAGAAVAASGSH